MCSQSKILSQVTASRYVTAHDLFRGAVLNDSPLIDTISRIADIQCFPYIMVRYDNTNTTFFQLSDDLFDVIQGEGINPCERLVKQHESGFCHKGPGDFQPSSLTAGQG